MHLFLHMQVISANCFPVWTMNFVTLDCTIHQIIWYQRYRKGVVAVFEPL